MTSTSGPAQTVAGSAQRQRILDTALALMAKQGVDGTGMRELADSAGMNVATLYYYFPSKRDLLVAVLEERGFVQGLGATSPASLTRNPESALAGLLNDMLGSMLEVEDFIRLMLGEVMRGDETARGVGTELFGATLESLERWVAECEPEVCEGPGAGAVARMLRAMLVGLFFEHVAGVLEGGDDPVKAFAERATEAAAVLRSRAGT